MDDRTLQTTLERAGAAGVRRAELQRLTGLPQRTLTRELDRLVQHGTIERAGHGVFRRPNAAAAAPALPTPGAEQVWQALQTGSLPAYLSGLDVLSAYVEHFVFQAPHLVITDRGAADTVATVLQQAEFVVLDPAGSGVRTPQDDRLVLLRELTTWRRYGVRGHLAPPELAWVDLYREVRRGRLAIGPLELGRILANLFQAGGDRRKLLTYARGHFGVEIRQLLSVGQPTTEFMAAVAQGYRGT